MPRRTGVGRRTIEKEARHIRLLIGGSNITSASLANEPFIVAALSGNLNAERVLTAGYGVLLTDGGANSTMTVTVINFSDGEPASTYAGMMWIDSALGFSASPSASPSPSASLSPSASASASPSASLSPSASASPSPSASLSPSASASASPSASPSPSASLSPSSSPSSSESPSLSPSLSPSASVSPSASLSPSASASASPSPSEGA